MVCIIFHVTNSNDVQSRVCIQYIGCIRVAWKWLFHDCCIIMLYDI